ncbi:MAG TPA: hypothetical protein DCX53_07395 [Anaerolineae bacterium]|nr:hypothetical protein [Anaerolineae bacterium]
MNNWHNEYMAEYHRKDLLDDSERIHLMHTATRSPVYHPSWLTRTMHGFAVWMISTGKELHERYELPNAHCHQKRSTSYAR